jgi:hypothetical protein
MGIEGHFRASPPTQRTGVRQGRRGNSYLYDIGARDARKVQSMNSQNAGDAGDRDAAMSLSTASASRRKVAMGYRGYGLPIPGNHLRRQCRPDAR